MADEGWDDGVYDNIAKGATKTGPSNFNAGGAAGKPPPPIAEDDQLLLSLSLFTLTRSFSSSFLLSSCLPRQQEDGVVRVACTTACVR